MSSLNKIQQMKFIKDYFHQFFDISLNMNLSTSDTINVIIPVYDLNILSESPSTSSSYVHDISIDDDFNIKECFSKYENTSIEREFRAIVTNVIDGDTIDVKIEKKDDEGNIYYDKERVRFVGIDTPETGYMGFEASKKFVTKACYEGNENKSDEDKKKIYLNIDSEKERDIYNRLLAVVIVDNKNLNEILLKEKLARVEYIPPSEFNPKDWMGPGTSIKLYNYKNDDFAALSPFIRKDFKNVVFTPQDNYDVVYPYEIYKEVFYIKANPYSEKIRMHILPKSYDCSDSVLLLKDDSISKRTIESTYEYKTYDKSNINAYYQVNGKDRDRGEIPNSKRTYNIENWNPDTKEASTYIQYNYNIKDDSRSYSNIEIYTGYRYNQTSPYYALHYTGVRDLTNPNKEDRACLIDVNIDDIGTKTNAIAQFKYEKDSNQTPQTTDDSVYINHHVLEMIQKEYGELSHIEDIGKLYRKKIKYINDEMYSEEEKYVKENGKNKIYREYALAEWVDQSKPSGGGTE